MLRRRPAGAAVALLRLLHLRPLSTAAAAPPLFTYLPDHPRPDAKHAETILAVPRARSGRLTADKERKAGRVPAILFEQEDGQHGGNKRLISVQTTQIRRLVNQLGYSFFLSRLFQLEVRPAFADDSHPIEKVRVLPRKLHLHSGTDAPLNVTFLRAPSSANLKIDVPLVFIGDDICPGLRKGAYLNTIERTVKYLCPADIVPPFIEVDLSELDIGQKIIMGDLKVHPALKLIHPAERPVCNIIGSMASVAAAAPEAKKASDAKASDAKASDAKPADAKSTAKPSDSKSTAKQSDKPSDAKSTAKPSKGKSYDLWFMNQRPYFLWFGIMYDPSIYHLVTVGEIHSLRH